MKKDHINYFAVGSFVLAMLALLIASMLYISGRGDATDTYYVSYTDISGIHDGTTVTYGGYKIGKIKNVQPLRDKKGTRYRITLAVRAGWTIPSDSTAQITSPGILAEKTIEIREGKSTSLLSVGDKIKSLPAIDMMAIMNRLSGEFGEFTEADIRPLIKSLSHYLNGIGDDLNRQLPQITKDTRTLLTTMNKTAVNMNKLINADSRKHLHSMFKNTNKMSQSLLTLSQRLNDTTDKLDHLMEKSQQLLDDNSDDIRQSVVDMRTSLETLSQNIDSMVHNMNASARNMNELSRELRRNPSLIINSKPTPNPQE
ncbi:MAG: MCE family protein [Gammaproteobacteria bacterium]|nr:MCE family protein [Gammaproteobacteria bacterium]